MRPLIPLWTRTEVGPAVIARVGGKARGLHLLDRYGFPTPPWCVLDIETFEEAWRERLFQADRELARSDLALPAERARLRTMLGEWAGSLEVPAEVLDRVMDVTSEWTAMSVRSSATIEDDPDQSFAGQFASRLNVAGRDAVREAILEVWRSVAGEGVLLGLARRRAPPSLPRMAVIFQQMVATRVFAVVASRDLAGGRPDRMIVSAAPAEGPKVVEGRVETDHFVLPRSGGAFDVRSVMSRPCLSVVELDRIRRSVLKLERLMGRVLDLELTFDAGDEVDPIRFLQVRPLTGEAAPLEAHPAERAALWDDSNIAESYSGSTATLTLSFIKESYASVYRETGEVLGLDASDLRANETIYRNLLGFFDGHVYYNLRSWYQLALQLPGGEKNARHMERMMGVKERLPSDDARCPGLFKRLGHGLKLVGLIRHQPELARAFEHTFQTFRERYRARDFQDMELPDLVATYRAMQADLRGRWTAPIVADIFSMTFYGALRDMARRWLDDPGGLLVNDLVASSIRSVTTEPVRELMRLASKVRADEGLRATLAGTPADGLERVLAENPAAAWLDEALDAFAETYGDRFVGELKLESLSMRQDRRWILAVLRGYVEAGTRPAPADPKERSVLAWDRVMRSLGPLKRWIFGFCLEQARRAIGYREAFRFHRSQLFGLVRELMRVAGERLFAAGCLDDPDDIFCLTVDEILGFVDGTATTSDLAGLVRIRRRDRPAGSRRLPGRFFTLGAAGLSKRWPSPAGREEGAVPGGEALAGTGCCAGQVEAEAVVLAGTEDPPDLAGKILVALSNDPGWVPLYAHIAGLVLERGSALSHAANVAREMGIPTVVGVAGLLQRVRTGDRLWIDGARGAVRRLAGAQNPPPVPSR